MAKTKSIYVVLIHHYSPSKQHNGKWEVRETCDIVDSLKKRHLCDSTVVLNLTEQKLEKNRGGNCDVEQYNVLLSYLKETYSDQFQELDFNENVEQHTEDARV